ncbi:MAG: helix-turn-helix domain-containing protein [Sedimentibacter sp.]|uniref:helix-turn-helix domain-containing protein n=1 Tax=Sedimentibacter sp. TaxID=1960295 RepID=UPI003158D816
MNYDFGTKIREVRKAKKLSIAELSEKSGVSNGMISQIERNTVIPSAVVLAKIARALGQSVSYFFGEEGLEDSIVLCKKGEHKKIKRSNNRGYIELLTPKGRRQIELIKVVIYPGIDRNNDPVSHPGEECGIVIQGTLTVIVNQNKYCLQEGDSIQFDSTIPHCYLNEGETECISIWAEQPYTW